MSEVSEKNTVIDQNWLNTKKNPKADLSTTDLYMDYLGGTNGAYRNLQALQKSLKIGSQLAKEMGCQPSETISSFQTNLGIGLNTFGFPRLPLATASAIKSLSELRKDDNGIPFSRKAAKAVRDTAEAIAAYGFCSVFIKGNPTISAVAQASDFTSDVMDLQISATDYYKSSELEAVATGDAKGVLNHSKSYYFLRVLKAVVALAGSIFGYVLMITGGSLLPLVALLILSLSGVILAITRDLYKDTGRYPVINFDREVLLMI